MKRSDEVGQGEAPALTREQLLALMQMLGIDPEGEEDSDGEDHTDEDEVGDDVDVSHEVTPKKEKERLDEEMYQAVRAGDKEAFLEAIEKGTFERHKFFSFAFFKISCLLSEHFLEYSAYVHPKGVSEKNSSFFFFSCWLQKKFRKISAACLFLTQNLTFLSSCQLWLV